MESGPAKDTVIRGHVFRSTASNLVGQAVILGTGFLLAPFVLHHVGASDYGLWILISSLTGYASVLEFGISSAVIKYVAEFRIKGEREEMHALVEHGAQPVHRPGHPRHPVQRRGRAAAAAPYPCAPRKPGHGGQARAVRGDWPWHFHSGDHHRRRVAGPAAIRPAERALCH